LFVRTKEGSTERLIQLCAGYFVFYVITGYTVKYFLGKPELGLPGMTGIEYLVYSTVGGTAICLAVVLVLRWYHLRSNKLITWGPLTFPSEYLYIIPSGLCTAVVIPTTTLMYTLPISVMVAMVMMRGSVIVISRVVDAIQIRQGILQKKVYWEENVAVVFALLAVSVNLFGGDSAQVKGGFDFLQNAAAVSILGSYIVAYLIRIYIMNYYKNTRPKGAPSDNRGFFAVEQIASTLFMLLAAVLFFFAPSMLGIRGPLIEQFRGAIASPLPAYREAILSGMAYGMVAFFSVFIFMFKGRTATFAGLVNRLTSLIAGTVSTLLFALTFDSKWPKGSDWASLVVILVAVAFLTRAEKRRALELAQEK
jgi:hypothetical protein